MTGLIVKALSGFYYVETEKGIIECKARGKFKSAGQTPLVGDRVEISVLGKQGTVDKICERKNMLFRPPLANIDKLFIVSSSVTPAPNTLLIDRMTAICEYKGIKPVILFNKNDLEDVSSWCNIYKNAGYKTIACSAVKGEGIGEIREELKDCISAFTGNSGAGKSSLLNIIFPNLELSTGEVSSKLGRGRHTTRHTELFCHSFGGYVADTPGFSSLEADKDDLNFKESLSGLFPEFSAFASDCRFTDCAHIGEKGCAVCRAVENQEIERTRYASYKTVYDELKDVKAWNIRK
ncbi:MAG: ribosome small subunit-dependent GTPase A [Ruminococcaceae bacterium]|nr:ribosome small subunit-dependent GTPase A [Oscillospiraceae bacterium]